jgi:hypothetical protein
MFKENFKRFFRFISDDLWLSLYDRRRLNAFELNSRNTLTIAFTGTILALLLGALSLKAISQPDFRAFVDGRDGFYFLQEKNVRYEGVRPRRIDCTTGCGNSGVPTIADSAALISSPEDLNDISISKTVLPSSSLERFWARLDVFIDPTPLSSINKSEEYFVFALPQISYQFARVQVNGDFAGTFANNTPIRLTIPRAAIGSEPLAVRVTFSLHNNGIAYLNRSDLIPAYVSTFAESSRMEQYRISRKDNSGAMVGMMSRVLIGVFALMLFIFIDSAPESLGLALFLGFEALAIGLGQGWMSSSYNPFMIHYSYQMGDIFRLYFFLQLARVAKPNPRMWLLIGTLLSIPYGFAKQMEVAWQIDGLPIIPRIRDATAGTLGALACLRTLWSIRGKKLPWRRIALILGAIGSAQQVLGPITHYWPELNESANFRGLYVVLEALSVYVLALSTFTNISTLENRVRSLSAAKAKSDLIEQELELGRTVQRAFLNIPKVPHDFEVIGSLEAAVYVSGDIYFVHWDEVEQRLALVLSDVTGHGVQASLKATACFMVARNLWQSRAPQESSQYGIGQKSKLKSFHRQTTDILGLFNPIPDIATFVGIEIFPRKRRAYLYRNNFHTPIILAPNDSGAWDLEIPAVVVGEVFEYSIKPGTVFVLFSDGFITGTRQLSDMRRFIRSRLDKFDGHAETMKNIMHDFNEQNLQRPVDDRTLLVLSWKRDEYLSQPKKTA